MPAVRRLVVRSLSRWRRPPPAARDGETSPYLDSRSTDDPRARRSLTRGVRVLFIHSFTPEAERGDEERGGETSQLHAGRSTDHGQGAPRRTWVMGRCGTDQEHI